MNLARFIEQVCKPSDWPGSQSASQLVGQDAKYPSSQVTLKAAIQAYSQPDSWPGSLTAIFCCCCIFITLKAYSKKYTGTYFFSHIFLFFCGFIQTRHKQLLEDQKEGTNN